MPAIRTVGASVPAPGPALWNKTLREWAQKQLPQTEMFLSEKNLGLSWEEPGVIPLFKTVFDRMSKDEHHRDVPARERVLKRGMAHGSPEGRAK